MNTVGYFEIQADNLTEARAFYTSVFGWTFMEEKGFPIEFWRIGNAGINGGLLPRPAKVPGGESGANAFVCSVEVEDFDEISRIILNMGGQVALPKFAVPGRCYQGYFLDTQGNTFGIFETDPKAS